MIIIEVCFERSWKPYKYLLVNPNNYKIEKEKPLTYTYGVNQTTLMTTYMTTINAYKVEELPKIVTSQIVLLDNNNNVEIQKIGEIKTIFKEHTSTNTENKTENKNSQPAAAFEEYIQKELKQRESYLRKIINKQRRY